MHGIISLDLYRIALFIFSCQSQVLRLPTLKIEGFAGESTRENTFRRTCLRRCRMRRHFDPDRPVAVRKDFQRLMESAARAEVRSRDARPGRLPLALARAPRPLPLSNARLVSSGLQSARDNPVSGPRLRQGVRRSTQDWLSAIQAAATPSRRTAV